MTIRTIMIRSAASELVELLRKEVDDARRTEPRRRGGPYDIDNAAFQAAQEHTAYAEARLAEAEDLLKKLN